MKLFCQLWKRIVWLPLLLLFALPVQAQVCPAGTSPVWYGSTRDQLTDQIRNPICVDVEGRLNFSLDTLTVGDLNNAIFVDGVSVATVQEALARCLIASCNVRIPAGSYDITTSITVGDGTNSTQSTRHNISIIGAGSGTGDTISNTQIQGATRIRWTGASGGGPMMSVDGPLHNFILKGIHFDANNLADDGLRLIHVRDFKISDVVVTNWRDQAFEFNTIAAASLPTGVAYGMGSGVVENITAAAPALTSSQGLLCTADDRLSVNCGQITFIDLLIQAGTAASDALELGYADNLTFISTRLLGTGGVMRFTQPAGGPTFPKNNTFVSFFASGGVTGTAGTDGGNLFWPYNTDGSAAIPNMSGVLGFSQQEERLFGFSPALDNNRQYQIRTAAGSAERVIMMNTSDVILVGNTLRAMVLQASGGIVEQDRHQFHSVTFSALGTPSNGSTYYCSDCTIANPCAGAGTGALAKRLNGVWVCD